jgi:hypothetical protein
MSNTKDIEVKLDRLVFERFRARLHPGRSLVVGTPGPGGMRNSAPPESATWPRLSIRGALPPLPAGVHAELQRHWKEQEEEAITGHRQYCLKRTYALGFDLVRCTCGGARRASMRALMKAVLLELAQLKKARRR